MVVRNLPRIVPTIAAIWLVDVFTEHHTTVGTQTRHNLSIFIKIKDGVEKLVDKVRIPVEVVTFTVAEILLARYEFISFHNIYIWVK